jgi:hypothetical protein
VVGAPTVEAPTVEEIAVLGGWRVATEFERLSLLPRTRVPSAEQIEALVLEGWASSLGIVQAEIGRPAKVVPTVQRIEDLGAWTAVGPKIGRAALVGGRRMVEELAFLGRVAETQESLLLPTPSNFVGVSEFGKLVKPSQVVETVPMASRLLQREERRRYGTPGFL